MAYASRGRDAYRLTPGRVNWPTRSLSPVEYTDCAHLENAVRTAPPNALT